MFATRRAALLAALAGGACTTSQAQEPSTVATRAYVLPSSEVLPLHSAINSVDYLIYVRTPPDYADGAASYPVIVTLDADYSFAICANHLEHLADRMNQAPKAILISIAYPGVYPDMSRYRAARTRDYTPVFVRTGGYGPEFQAHSGGAPAFLRVIEEEVLPLVEGRYRTTTERMLVGHSYGGLFTAWVLQTRPDLFDRYLMVSPSLWYADRWILTQEAQLAATRLPRMTRAYVAAGSLEEQPGSEGRMVTEATRFATMLAARGDPKLAVTSRVFEDETHASIFPAAFSTGVRHLYAAT